jgi:hypothetical protein
LPHRWTAKSPGYDAAGGGADVLGSAFALRDPFDPDVPAADPEALGGAMNPASVLMRQVFAGITRANGRLAQR